MIVQIYEIQDPYEAEKCVELGVDHVGSVLLSEDEWKNRKIKDVVRICQEGGFKSSLIPLYKNEDLIFRTIDYYEPDLIHFCENLTDDHGRKLNFGALVEFQARLKEKFPEVSITRSIPVPAKDMIDNFPSLEIAKELQEVSDYFLIDTWLGKEPVEGFVGITGVTADWDIARELVEHVKVPVILAGGLSPENVYEAILKVKPAGVDSCTRTNLVDKDGRPMRFKKDFEKVTRFVTEARKAEAELLSQAE